MRVQSLAEAENAQPRRVQTGSMESRERALARITKNLYLYLFCLQICVAGVASRVTQPISQKMATIPTVPAKQPLPLNPFHPGNLPDLHHAYNQCLTSESEAESEEEVMYARCLGYLLIEVPTSRGKHMIAEDITLCNGDAKGMGRLAKLYINHIIRLCKSAFTKLDPHRNLDVCVSPTEQRSNRLPSP
jgi:hypothetical protein